MGSSLSSLTAAETASSSIIIITTPSEASHRAPPRDGQPVRHLVAPHDARRERVDERRRAREAREDARLARVRHVETVEFIGVRGS
jgi:hypothetical protein|eukprot:29872-Pelagococcus_subviridis.AAC.2